MVNDNEIGVAQRQELRWWIAEITNDGRRATHVGVTVRTRTFVTQVKTGNLPEPTTDGDVVAAGARRVLARFEITRPPVRLLRGRLDLAPSDEARTVNG